MAVPTTVSITVNAASTTCTIVWSESVNNGTLSASIGGVALAYSSGTGTATMVYSLATATLYSLTTYTLTMAGGSVTSVSTADPNIGILLGAVTNNSDVPKPIACTGPACGMMTNSATIKRAVRTQSATSGGISNAWSNYQTTRCAIQGKSASERVSSDQETGGYSFIGYFPTGVDLQTDDRIGGITGAGGLSGVTLVVAGNPFDEAGRGAFLVVPLQEVP